MKLRCVDWEDRVIAYADLAPAERAAVHVHIAGCHTCRLLHQRIAAVDRRLDAASIPSTVSDGFAGRVLSAAAVLPQSRKPLLPDLLDATGWAAALWIGAFILRELTRL